MALQKLLGTDTLLGKSGPVDTSTIEGKAILLYFSAHWCGPCRQFTPMLSRFYQQQKKKRDDFEIIFVTGDRSKDEFETYYSEHPWLTMPYGGEAEKKIRDKLNHKFKVRGIPSLVVVDKDGKTATTDGTRFVQSDPEGKNFPWIPKTIYETLATTTMTTKDGAPLTVDDLKKLDAFSLYFSASWSPPCRAFTPVLSSTFNKLKNAGTKTEFIYIPSDKDVGSYTTYYESMPWSSLVFGSDAVSALKQACEVNGIPTLVTCKGSDGSIINTGARAAAGADPEGAEYPWEKKPLPPCSPFDSGNDEVIDAINEEACVVLSVNDAANKDAVVAEFTKAAEKYVADNKDSEYPIHFFVNATASSAELYGRVLQAIGGSAPKPGTATVKTMHLSNDRAHADLSGEITMASVLEHVASFKKAHA